MNKYKILSSSIEIHHEVKKSQFITFLKHCDSEDSFKLFLNQLKTRYPDARHYCYAHKLGAPNNSQKLGFSDDGEPKGTAGKPILNVLLGQESVGEIAAVVVRYFGGTKLGTGGLVRAYSDAVNLALSQAKYETKELTQTVLVSTDFNNEAQIRHLCLQQQWHLDKIDYQANGITINLNIPLSCTYQETVALINGLLNGKVDVSKVDYSL